MGLCDALVLQCIPSAEFVVHTYLPFPHCTARLLPLSVPLVFLLLLFWCSSFPSLLLLPHPLSGELAAEWGAVRCLETSHPFSSPPPLFPPSPCQTSWLQAIRGWQEEFVGSISAREFVEAVTGDILGSRIFVFTPKGEVRRGMRGGEMVGGGMVGGKYLMSGSSTAQCITVVSLQYCHVAVGSCVVVNQCW